MPWKPGTTLDRDVAIKVLPDAFASDPERLARFEREAGDQRAGKVRQHTGLGVRVGRRATLADRIKQGPIPEEYSLYVSLWRVR